MQDQRAAWPNSPGVPSNSTHHSTTAVPRAQTHDGSNQDEYQLPENPDYVEYPDTWLWEPRDLSRVVGKEVDLKSKEARRITKHFSWPSLGSNYSGGCRLVLTRIVRVQNKALWTRYYRRKQRMKQQRKGRLPRERRLFHGTRARNIDSICKHGFQICRPVLNGIRLGKGHYFSREIWYANTFSRKTGGKPPKIVTSFVTKTSSESGSTGQRSSKLGSDESTDVTQSRTEDPAPAAAAAREAQDSLQPRRYMLMCTVLTGRSHRTHESFEKLPERFSDRYDSCFQRVHGSVQYVVYHDSQTYPQYVIEYFKNAAESSR